MSNPEMHPVPVSLLSSDKILTPEIASKDHNLLSLWGGAFYHPTFVNTAAEILGLGGRSTCVCDDETTQSVSNVLYRTRLGARVATLPLLFQYFGPIRLTGYCDGERCAPLYENLGRDFDFVHLSLPPGVGLPKMESGEWRVIPQKTIAVSREMLSRWGSDFRDDVKNKIRKARKAGIKISRTDSLPAKLWSASYLRKSSLTPIEPNALSRWADSLIKVPLLRIYLAEIDDIAVAFRGQMIFGNFAYDWIAGSDPQFHSSGVNQLLMAEIGDELSKLSLAAWDLVGGEIASIADFKKSFGASEITHYHLIRSFNLKGRLYSLLKSARHAIG
jgi:hypothetical protein